MTSNAMRQLEERHMTSKVELLVWSNKMDLLALSNAKGEVSLHRLSWQKLWSLLPPTEDCTVKGIAWRPDGQVIAIGYSNNDVLLVDVENKDLLHKLSYSSEVDEQFNITCMQWLEGKQPEPFPPPPHIPDNSQHFLTQLPPISRSFGSINEESSEFYEDSKKVTEQENLNFLIVGFSDGSLKLSAFGLFDCGTVQAPEKFRNGLTIEAIEMSTDLNRLFVVVVNESTMTLLMYDTSLFMSFYNDIHALGYKYGQLMSLLDYLDTTMLAITEAYENMLILEMESKLCQYAESMPEGSVSADFLELLMFGIISTPLETFLLQDLTDKGIKKLGHSIELSHSNIQKLILKHLQAVGQNLAFHLSELRGMSRMSERFLILGFDESCVSKSFMEVGSFLVKAFEVLYVIDDSVKKYRTLFKWLYAIILKLTDDRLPDSGLPEASQQDTAFIADYLYNLEGSNCKEKKKHCYLDPLGQYLADSNLTNPISNEFTPWENLLQENPCLANHPLVIPRKESASLVQQYNSVKSIIKDTFSHPKKSIEKSISDCVDFSISPVSSFYKASILYVAEDDKLLLVCLSEKNTTSFLYKEIHISKKTSFQALIYFQSKDDDVGLKTRDLQIYSSEIISLLLEQPGQDRGAVFVQMPVRAIKESILKYKEEMPSIEGTSLLESGALRPIENMVASRLSVSGARKVAVLLSENMHKVRTYEMEVEEDEEEEDMETTRESDSSSLQQSI